MPYRVIQWSTGNVGHHTLRGIVSHPDLELAGLWVHSPAKVGKDAGRARRSGHGHRRGRDRRRGRAARLGRRRRLLHGDRRPAPQEAVDDMCRMLAPGKHVVATSVVSLLYPPSGAQWLGRNSSRRPAGRRDTACFTSGIDPGFANDLLPFVLSGFAERIDTIRVVENLDYSTYMQPEVLFDTMGFGQAPRPHAPAPRPGRPRLRVGRRAAHDRGRARRGARRHPRGRASASRPGRARHRGRAVAAGTMAALRFEVQGWIRGRAAIVIEHVTRHASRYRARLARAPGQRRLPHHRGGYHLLHGGAQMTGEDGDHNTGGLAATGMRILNAIPAVCAAAPGLLSTLDLPLVTGQRPLSRRHVPASGRGQALATRSGADVPADRSLRLSSGSGRPALARAATRGPAGAGARPATASGAAAWHVATPASTTSQSRRASSPSSWPGPQPA